MITALIFVLLILVVAFPYWIRIRKHRNSGASVNVGNTAPQRSEPVTLHPKIDLLQCIGCGSCVQICPERVLSLVDGHAAIIHGEHCVSHALCETVCPVGAITMGFGAPREGMEIPYYDEHYETNVPNLFIAGELGGIGLIRNAIRHGTTAVEVISQRGRFVGEHSPDVLIVGAGPAGLAAALMATVRGLHYVILEQDVLGGSILHYPRKKLVLTQPVELPLHGIIKGPEISKEDLLALFHDIVHEHHLNIKEGQRVQSIEKPNGMFHVQTQDATYEARTIILAMGRRGTPNKLAVPGEELPKVMYKLLEAEQYQEKHILIVGGGDSAIEAAAGLAAQQKNRITLSYRKESFVRLKEKNRQRIDQLMKEKKINVVFQSHVVRIKEGTVELKIKETESVELQNDFVFIFAGGVLPTEFLKKCGIALREGESQTG